MNLGQTLLNEDIRAVHFLTASHAMRKQYAHDLCLYGHVQMSIVAVLVKHGPMSKNLLLLAIRDRPDTAVSRTVNQMVRRGRLLVEARGAINVLRLAVTQ